MLNVDHLRFFLGGHDLEMVTIRNLLAEDAVGRFYDKNLSWGAKASAYNEEIEKCLVERRMPVLIELEDDLNLSDKEVIIVDHHDKRAGSDQPTSLHQVFELLHLPPEKWTRWFNLVAANDRGYIPAMLEIGATKEEMIQVRSADRLAQGITSEEETKGENAVVNADVIADGMLTIVRLQHTRTATVTDRLEPALGGSGYKNLLILSPKEVNFFGAGNLVFALNKKFPGGWYGGALPDMGFWGYGESVPDVPTFLLDYLKNRRCLYVG